MRADRRTRGAGRSTSGRAIDEDATRARSDARIDASRDASATSAASDRDERGVVAGDPVVRADAGEQARGRARPGPRSRPRHDGHALPQRVERRRRAGERQRVERDVDARRSRRGSRRRRAAGARRRARRRAPSASRTRLARPVRAGSRRRRAAPRGSASKSGAPHRERRVGQLERVVERPEGRRSGRRERRRPGRRRVRRRRPAPRRHRQSQQRARCARFGRARRIGDGVGDPAVDRAHAGRRQVVEPGDRDARGTVREHRAAGCARCGRRGRRGGRGRPPRSSAAARASSSPARMRRVTRAAMRRIALGALRVVEVGEQRNRSRSCAAQMPRTNEGNAVCASGDR